VGEQGVQEGTKHTPLWGSVLRVSVAEMMLPILTTWCQPVRKSRIQLLAEGNVQSQGPKLGDELGGDSLESVDLIKNLTHVGLGERDHPVFLVSGDPHARYGVVIVKACLKCIEFV
jgi:hypothetical protein